MDWVKPKELEQALLGPLGGSAEVVLKAICGRVSAGSLAITWDSLMVDGLRSEDPDKARQLFALGRTGAGRLGGTWVLGDLSGAIQKDKRGYQFHRVELAGVRFSRADAEAMGAEFDSVASATVIEKPPSLESLAYDSARPVVLRQQDRDADAKIVADALSLEKAKRNVTQADVDRIWSDRVGQKPLVKAVKDLMPDRQKGRVSALRNETPIR